MDSWTWLVGMFAAFTVGFALALWMHTEELDAVWKLYEATLRRARRAEDQLAADQRRTRMPGSGHDD